MSAAEKAVACWNAMLLYYAELKEEVRALIDTAVEGG